MRQFGLYGIGNGIMDVLLPVSEEDFQALGLEKGSMRLVTIDVQRRLLEHFSGSEPRLCSGGSAANTVIGYQQLGGKAAFACCLGKDQYGQFYKQEFSDLGIELAVPLADGEDTGTSLVLITPDSERTMQTSLGVAAQLSAKHINEEMIRLSEWLYIEGYLLADPIHGQAAVDQALRYARASGTRVAVTFSDGFIVDLFKEPLERVVKSADLVFANRVESCKFTRASTPEKAFEILKEQVPNVVVTMSEQGALVRYEGDEGRVSAFPCTPVDLTGAGDIFAAGFLYGVTTGVSPIASARAGAYLAMKVITQVGARLRGDLRRLWNEIPR